MGYVSIEMGDHFSALLLSLMALRLALVDRNPFQPCYFHIYLILVRKFCFLLFNGIVLVLKLTNGDTFLHYLLFSSLKNAGLVG